MNLYYNKGGCEWDQNQFTINQLHQNDCQGFAVAFPSAGIFKVGIMLTPPGKCVVRHGWWVGVGKGDIYYWVAIATYYLQDRSQSLMGEERTFKRRKNWKQCSTGLRYCSRAEEVLYSENELNENLLILPKRRLEGDVISV